MTQQRHVSSLWSRGAGVCGSPRPTTPQRGGATGAGCRRPRTCGREKEDRDHEGREKARVRHRGRSMKSLDVGLSCDGLRNRESAHGFVRLVDASPRQARRGNAPCHVAPRRGQPRRLLPRVSRGRARGNVGGEGVALPHAAPCRDREASFWSSWSYRGPDRLYCRWLALSESLRPPGLAAKGGSCRATTGPVVLAKSAPRGVRSN